ncbi:MAG: hypothetical protein JWP91_13 [Fibrobacteres bacterium]|nr:hypothetical protein [Fibrobacterota bacterium]
MKSIPIPFFNLFTVLALILTGCDLMSSRVSQGGGSEATNGSIAGTGVYGNGEAASWSSVILRTTAYLKDTSKVDRIEIRPDALADESGDFKLDSILPGAYLIEIRDGQGRASVSSVNVARGTILNLPADTLRGVGKIEGVLEAIPGAAAPGIIQVYGMEQAVRADSMGHFSFRSLPMGRHRFHPVAALAGWAYPDFSASLDVPGATVDLGLLPLKNSPAETYSQWMRSRKILLTAGYGSAEDTLADFPILVRLDSETFDFSATDGRDIRFSGRNDRHLAFEIESYDPVRKRAEIWVAADTLIGAKPDGFLTMHWGKPGAPAASDGKRVFASNYGAAWHLRGTPDVSGRFAYADASPAAFLGEGTAVPDDPAAIGVGASFTAGQYILVPDPGALRPSVHVSISAWLRADTADTAGGEIASLGDNYGLRVLPDGNLRFFMFHDSLWREGDPAPGSVNQWKECVTTGLHLLDGEWHHVAGVFDGSLMRVYADGVEAARLARPGKVTYPYGKDLWMGRHGSGSHETDFRGILDEVRISRKALSAAWIRTEYESQKPDSRFLKFE